MVDTSLMKRVQALSHSGSHAAQRWLRGVLTLAMVFGAVWIAFPAFTPTASSQEAPGLGRVRERLARAQTDATAAHDRYEQAVIERDEALVRIDELEQSIASARAREAVLRSALTRRAVALYKNSDPTGFHALDTAEPMEAGRRTKFNEFADDYYREQADLLRETADRQQREQVDLRAKHTELGDVITRLEREIGDAEQKVARATRGLEIAEGLAPLRALGEPVMGPSVLNAAEMAAWLRSSSASPRLSDGMSIELIAQMFVDEGAAENVRGDVAFAQAYIETGGFSAGGSDNNFSGLGACDGCGGQNQFPNAREGIRAQMQLLKAYAGGGPLVNPASPYWWGGDPLSAASKYASFGGTGDAPSWRVMGGGKWASDPAYSSKVLGTYDKMIAVAGGS
jgi:Mannosyl-glycoprotein endo-beta-N-acetylglucosaminidase